MVDGNEYPVQLQLAAQLIDETAGARRNEQGWLFGPARYCLGDGTMEPVR